MTASLRHLPSVDRVLRELSDLGDLPASLVAEEIRGVLAQQREQLLAGGEIRDQSVASEVRARLLLLLEHSLKPVINATGIVLHTNLGRAPLPHFNPIGRYSNLEYDLRTGRRGKRDTHTSALLQRLIGRPAIVVNNNAAAVFLVLHELAAGSEVIVSRGELIEIGDGFRIPDIMARSGAVLREVGTTNRTSLDDYRRAVNDKTRLILRVHPSNFQVTGFTAKPGLKDLCALGRETGVPVYEDLGSGCLVDLQSAGVNEPLVKDSIAAGVNIVSFSCDKLLGGPQSGIIAGDPDLVSKIRQNPMYRALRVDKLIIESLQTTLRELVKQNWSAVPTLQMIFTSTEALHERAVRIARNLAALQAQVRESASPIGGGSTPDQTLPTWLVELPVAKPNAFEAKLRAGVMPLIARIEAGKVVLDMRTVADEEEPSLIQGVLAAANSSDELPQARRQSLADSEP